MYIWYFNNVILTKEYSFIDIYKKKIKNNENWK